MILQSVLEWCTFLWHMKLSRHLALSFLCLFLICQASFIINGTVHFNYTTLAHWSLREFVNALQTRCRNHRVGSERVRFLKSAFLSLSLPGDFLLQESQEGLLGPLYNFFAWPSRKLSLPILRDNYNKIGRRRTRGRRTSSLKTQECASLN